MAIKPPSVFDTQGFERSRLISEPFDGKKDYAHLLKQLTSACTKFGYLGISPQNLGSPTQLERIIVLRQDQRLQVFLDPRIEEFAGTRECYEGCANISLWKSGKKFVPGVRTTRPLEINLSFINADGERMFQRFRDPTTVDIFENTAVSVICHEIDHLNGRLITDMSHERLEQALLNFKTAQDQESRKAAIENMPYVLLFSGSHYDLHHGVEFLKRRLPTTSPDCICLDLIAKPNEVKGLRIRRNDITYKIKASRFLQEIPT